jgi:hypothetical protein
VAHLSSNALTGSGAVLGGAWVVEMAETNIPAAKTYKLSWGCPRWVGREEKAGDSPKRAFSVRFPAS